MAADGEPEAGAEVATVEGGDGGVDVGGGGFGGEGD